MNILKYTSDEISECALLDEKMKKYQDRIVELRQKSLTKSWSTYDNLELAQMISALNTCEDKFATLKCRDKIEYQRLLNTADTITNYAIKAENTILPKNRKEQIIYAVLGSIVVLTSLFIILKKR